MQQSKAERLRKTHLMATGYNILGALLIPQLFLGSMTLYFTGFMVHQFFLVKATKTGEEQKVKFREIGEIYTTMLPFVIAGLVFNAFLKGKDLLKWKKST